MVGILGHSCHVGLTADVTDRLWKIIIHMHANIRNMGLFFWSSSVSHVIVAITAANPLMLKDTQTKIISYIRLEESWMSQGI